MKDWKCPSCSTVRESGDEVYIYFCPGCTGSMEIENKKEEVKVFK